VTVTSISGTTLVHIFGELMRDFVATTAVSYSVLMLVLLALYSTEAL